MKINWEVLNNTLNLKYVNTLQIIDNKCILVNDVKHLLYIYVYLV